MASQAIKFQPAPFRDALTLSTLPHPGHVDHSGGPVLVWAMPRGSGTVCGTPPPWQPYSCMGDIDGYRRQGMAANPLPSHLCPPLENLQAEMNNFSPLRKAAGKGLEGSCGFIILINSASGKRANGLSGP